MTGLESAAAGGAAGAIVKGAIEVGVAGVKWGQEEVKKLAMQFKEGIDISIIGKEDFEDYAASAKTPEYTQIKNYVEDRKNRSIMLTGIRLRKLEKNKEFEKIERIKKAIHQHAGKSGIRLAQFVQSGLFLRSWSILFGDAGSENELKKELNRVINELDKYVDFIEAKDSVQPQINETYTRIVANKPPLYMLGASGYDAIEVLTQIIKGLKEKKLRGYDFEEQRLMNNKKYYVFIKREDGHC